jgi:Uma2 family endonuclease
MTAMPVAHPMTADEYLALPDDGRRTQLVEGEVILNETKMPHQRVVVKLLVALSDWIRDEAGRGEVILPLDVRIDDLNVYGPDLLWYADGHVPARPVAPSFPVPDLAVEVRSPSTWRYDIGAKKSGYERSGLPELWLVDTAADEVLVFRRSRPAAAAFDVSLELTNEDVLRSLLLPGFELPLRSLF